jgi:hypothetical protein
MYSSNVKTLSISTPYSLEKQTEAGAIVAYAPVEGADEQIRPPPYSPYCNVEGQNIGLLHLSDIVPDPRGIEEVVPNTALAFDHGNFR